MFKAKAKTGHRLTVGEDKAFGRAGHVAKATRYQRYATCGAERGHYFNR